MPPSDLRASAIWLLLAFGLSSAVFTLWPGLDLWFSGLFHDPATGFWLVQSRAFEFWRDLVWNLSIGLFLIALVGLIATAIGRRFLGVAGQVWGFIAALYFLGPFLLVDRLLKEHWGRARPAQVTEFGGTEGFTPALLPTDQCADNCSFVSGEGSAAVTLGICMIMLRPTVARWLPAAGVKAWSAAAFLIPLATLLQRIATGRHFLSDSVFAAIFMLALALFLGRMSLGPGRRT
jgi:hypothetical protein